MAFHQNRLRCSCLPWVLLLGSLAFLQVSCSEHADVLVDADLAETHCLGKEPIAALLQTNKKFERNLKIGAHFQEGMPATTSMLGVLAHRLYFIAMSKFWPLLVVAGIVACVTGAIMFVPGIAFGMTQKGSDHAQQDPQFQWLAEIMEGGWVSSLVVFLIFVDIVCTGISSTIHYTDLTNPENAKRDNDVASVCHRISLVILGWFFLEQILHLAAFGKTFFKHPWMVMDLIVISISVLCETMLKDLMSGWFEMLIILRLWKVVAIVAHVLRSQKKGSDEAAQSGTGAGEQESAPQEMHLTKKLGETIEEEGWQKQLGEFMESPSVSSVVISLIILDLTCTVINDTLENTEILNPKYEETGEIVAYWTKRVCLTTLAIFLVEQALHILAFGKEFFYHFWMVMDLVVVSVSLASETVLESWAEDMVNFLMLLRLWKVVAAVFDILHAEQERRERAEKMECESPEHKN